MPVEINISKLRQRAGEAEQSGKATAADLREAAAELQRLAVENQQIRSQPRPLPPSGRRWLAG
jgi:hypothetical protein